MTGSSPSQRSRGERGASAVEYGLLVAGIAALIVLSVFALGDEITRVFDDTCDSTATESACSP